MSNANIVRDSLPPGKTDISEFLQPFPALLLNAAKVSSVCCKASVRNSDFFRVINADPVLTAISYGLYHQIFSKPPSKFFGIAKIIIVLNINTVRNTVLNAAQRALVNEKAKNSFDEAAFVRHSLATAIVAMLLAKERGIKAEKLQEYYCAGLLHDIGKWTLSRTKDKKMEHDEAGGLTAALWGFPPSVRDAALFHHRYKNYSGAFADIVHHTVLADYLVNKAGIKTGRLVKAPCPDQTLWKRLGIDEHIFERIKAPFEAEMQKILSFITSKGSH
jgi:putative nucleotidyltransferase with HDIG domain